MQCRAGRSWLVCNSLSKRTVSLLKQKFPFIRAGVFVCVFMIVMYIFVSNSL